MRVLVMFATGLGAGLAAGGASCAVVQGGLLAGALGRGPRRAVAAKDADVPSGHCGPPPVRTSRALGAFLGARLAAHTILGALLGLAGAAVQPPPAARAVLLVAAGVLMFVLGARLAGVWLPRLPASWRLPRPRGLAAGGGPAGLTGPAALGAATVLVPCGATIGIELVAIASGGPAAGAAALAGFVVGSAPVLALLGVMAGRLARGRAGVVAGVVVAALAVWTVASGLRLGGWWVPDAGAADRNAAVIAADGVQRVRIEVRDRGYRPAHAEARAGVRTELVLVTKGVTGCTRAIVVPGHGVQRLLPVTGETRLDLGVPRAGTLAWSCAMGMYAGRLDFVQPP